MEILTNSISQTTTRLDATSAVSNKSTDPNKKTEPVIEYATFDSVQLSDASKMLSTAMSLAKNGNVDAQDFITHLEMSLKYGKIDVESLAQNAPKELQKTLDKQSISLTDTLQTIADYSSDVPPPPTPETVETKTGNATENTLSAGTPNIDEPSKQTSTRSAGNADTEPDSDTKKAAATGAARGGGASSSGTSQSTDSTGQQVQQLEQRIKEIEQEIAKLANQGRAKQTELSAKQTELSQAEAELASLQSEENGSSQ